VSASNTMTIHVLDKEYQVSCPPEERMALLESARQLDERMRKVKSTGSILGLERIAVMVGLNLTYDLLKAEVQPSINDDAEKRLSAVERKIDEALFQLENASLF